MFGHVARDGLRDEERRTVEIVILVVVRGRVLEEGRRAEVARGVHEVADRIGRIAQLRGKGIDLDVAAAVEEGRKHLLDLRQGEGGPQAAVGAPAEAEGVGAVAAGAIVTKTVEPYTIVAGTPAKTLRQRQPREIADRLIALEWWNWSHEALRRALDDFRTLTAEAFLERYDT